MEPAMKDALKSMLDNAYDNLKKYTQGLYEAQSKAVEAKTAYELAKAAKIVSGAIQGKNETESITRPVATSPTRMVNAATVAPSPSRR